jgi:branched-chain amino acid transport system substrate-binding protein
MPTTIRIGYCLSPTGPLAGNSRPAQLAHDIWREDVNSRGGLDQPNGQKLVPILGYR